MPEFVFKRRPTHDALIPNVDSRLQGFKHSESNVSARQLVASPSRMPFHLSLWFVQLLLFRHDAIVSVDPTGRTKPWLVPAQVLNIWFAFHVSRCPGDFLGLLSTLDLNNTVRREPPNAQKDLPKSQEPSFRQGALVDKICQYALDSCFPSYLQIQTKENQ
jgi:hypothetical protein